MIVVSQVFGHWDKVDSLTKLSRKSPAAKMNYIPPVGIEPAVTATSLMSLMQGPVT